MAIASIDSFSVASSPRSSQRSARQRQAGSDEQNQQPCHLRELDLCLASLAVFFQANTHPITNAEVTRQCKILMETETCLTNYTRRCMTEQQAELVDMVAEGGLETIRELCRPQSKLRTSYLKNGDCINQQHKAQRVCMRDFQVSLEKAVEIEWQDRLKLACCSFNKLNACTQDVIEPKCGSEAYELHKQMFRTSVSRMPSLACAKYEHNAKVCSSLLPPAGSQPKGSRSHSVLSKLFSAYTGQ